MRLSKISVKQLFKTFDHTVSLNLGERITIIHGLNGLGKTTLLQMVKNLSGGYYSRLAAVPFSEFKLDFDNGESIAVIKKSSRKHADSKRKPLGELTIKFASKGGEKADYKPEDNPVPETASPALDWLNRRIGGLDRVGPDRWRYHRGGSVGTLSTEAVIDQFGHLVPAELRQTLRNAPDWMKKIGKAIDVRLIETQRLLMDQSISTPYYDEFTEAVVQPGISPAITKHSEELAIKISKQESEYGALSQTLDRTFPVRYVQQKQKMSMSEDELRKRFQNLESKRRRLEEAGLLEKENTGFELPAAMDDATRGVMSIYVNDIEKKLSVFDDLAARIDLFREIINGHFMYKQLQVSRKKGFRFLSTPAGEELSATDLSSGEQHEVVLLYELLFHVKENSLVMIDEPEISLHIAWQEEFLRDLQRIIKLSPFDAVIATHSPQIVNERWDLTQELIGPVEVTK